MSRFWMVRAGENSFLIDRFLDRGMIAMRWEKMKDMSSFRNDEKLREEFEQRYPGAAPIHKSAASKFRFGMTAGDLVLTHDSRTDEYIVGEISGDYRYELDPLHHYDHIRAVKWNKGRIRRFDLSEQTRRTLRCQLALFEPNENVQAEIEEGVRAFAQRLGREESQLEE